MQQLQLENSAYKHSADFKKFWKELLSKLYDTTKNSVIITMYIITTNGYHERPNDWMITMLNSMPAYLSATNY